MAYHQGEQCRMAGAVAAQNAREQARLCETKHQDDGITATLFIPLHPTHCVAASARAACVKDIAAMQEKWDIKVNKA